MNNVDWDELLTPEQQQKAREIAIVDKGNPRLRDLLVNEVLVDMACPAGAERVLEGGFLKEYGGYLPPVLGRLLLEYVTGD